MKHLRKISYKNIAAFYSGVGLIVASVVFLVGCGSGGGKSVSDPSNASVAVTTAGATGRATLSIKWPDRPLSRLFPIAANSLRVDILRGGKTYDSRVVSRPINTSVPTVVSFDSLPVDTLTVRIAAYPTTDGTGVAQASGAAPLVITAGAVTDFGLITMASTIASVVVSPVPPNLIVGQQTPLVATAKDADGNIVLTPSTLVWSSSPESVATVDKNGVVTAAGAGTAAITATESESGKTGSAAVVAFAPAATLSFQTPLVYAAPAAGDVVAADFDGDGNADVAVASNKNLLLFYGKGDGTMGPANIVYTDANNIVPAGAADMNNDGKIDLVFRNTDDKVGVVWNAGSRTFDAPSFVSVGYQPNMVAVADFDGDGYRDLAAIIPGNGPGGSVAIAKNNGDKSFTKTKSYGIPGIAIGVTAADINKDNKPDLVTTFTTSTVDDSGFMVYLGNGSGGFTSGNRYGTASFNVVSPVVADFNRDAQPDIAVTNYFDHNISVHFGDGAGAFQRSAGYPAAPYPHIMRSADFDYDGWPDLVAANNGTGNFSVLRNRRNGLFYGQVTFNTGGSNTRTCDVADFNNDGKPDVVTGNESSNNISIILNNSQ